MTVHSEKDALSVTETDLRSTSSTADLGHVSSSLCASVTRMEIKLQVFSIRLASSGQRSYTQHLLNGP